jgi:molybdenum-dependent DNA-binding transcriptional regulator ModE
MQEMIGVSLQDITAFVAVAQTGSFTSAAERLGTNKLAVGKAVQRMEKHLATRLDVELAGRCAGQLAGRTDACPVIQLSAKAIWLATTTVAMP